MRWTSSNSGDFPLFGYSLAADGSHAAVNKEELLYFFFSLNITSSATGFHQTNAH